MTLSILRASLYYILLVLYTYMYNFIAECIYYAETTLKHKLDVSRKIMKDIGWYENIEYYYATSFLLILKIVGVKIHLTGTPIIKKRALWISNHRSKIDGPLIQALICAKENYVRSVIKNSVRYIPVFGSIGKHCGSIFIKRVKSIAEKLLTDAAIDTIKSNKSILIFPEGTTMNPEYKYKSDNFAVENNLPKLTNILLPRTTGYSILYDNGKFDIIGNVTIKYGNPQIPGYVEHSYMDLFSIFPHDVYINVEYTDIRPEKLFEAFEQKDKLLLNITNLEPKLPLDISKMALVFNAIIFISFYGICYYCPIFFLITLLISLYSVVKMMLN